MKSLNIIFILFITFSIGWAQNQSEEVHKIKEDYKQPKTEKVKSDKQNNSEKEEIKSTKVQLNTVDIHKTEQKVIPKIINTTENSITKEKKSFGSAKTSGQKQIFEKKPEQDNSTKTEAKDKVKKLFKKRVEVKETN